MQANASGFILALAGVGNGGDVEIAANLGFDRIAGDNSAFQRRVIAGFDADAAGTGDMAVNLGGATGVGIARAEIETACEP
ncbi:hypothetical protein J2X72_003050 [Phyllobacterium sp. 1468]|nr:hypothetical protein [Phyllobacterium sp. 1468]MDR6634240.1 hypothetical protein [Phyllobacterium sp. 1468]